MTTVVVFGYSKFDVISGETVVARRKATREFITAAGAEIIRGTDEGVDSSLIDANGQVRFTG
jgi:hypothetical protein